VEEEAATSDQNVSEKRNLEDRIVAIFSATENSFDTKPEEEQIGESIDDLCEIDGGIVILLGREGNAPVLVFMSGQRPDNNNNNIHRYTPPRTSSRSR
jgi:hypothetical protein